MAALSVQKAKSGMNTLFHLTHMVHVKAQDGQKGHGSNCYGKYGKDREVLVPVGTLVKDRETGVVLKDMVRAEERVVICQGGKGGCEGNLRSVDPAGRNIGSSSSERNSLWHCLASIKKWSVWWLSRRRRDLGPPPQ